MSAPPSTTSSPRPISPHLTIYRKQITSVMSILHRITGLALVVGTVFLVAWLWSAAYSPKCFASMHNFFGGFLGKIMLFGWSLAFYYHLFNGIRHLGWDMGRGLEIQTAERNGLLVIVACGAFTIISWIIAFSVTGAHP